jgi:hypothetical protein
MLSYLSCAAITCIFAYIFISAFPSNHQQCNHINTIIRSNEIDILATDFYNSKPIHNHILCPILHNMVRPSKKIYYYESTHLLAHNFTNTQLAIIGAHYMEKVYTRKNFPYTYRKTTYTRVNNETANKIYISTCKHFYQARLSGSIPILLTGITGSLMLSHLIFDVL